MVDLTTCSLRPGHIGSYAALCLVLQTADGDLSPDETGASLHFLQALGANLDGALQLSQAMAAKISESGNPGDVFLNGLRILSDLPQETLIKLYTSLEEIAYSDGLDDEGREAELLEYARKAWAIPETVIGAGESSQGKDWGGELDVKLAQRASDRGRSYPLRQPSSQSGCGLLVVGLILALTASACAALSM
jgi:hypothetical protein